MSRKATLALAVLMMRSFTSAQDTPQFKTEAKSALIWDERASAGDASSVLVLDPLTGHEIHKLTHAGVELSSRVGYEKVSSYTMGRLLIFSTTIANNRDSDVSVQYGGASIDDEISPPLSFVAPGGKVKKHTPQSSWQLNNIHCLNSGFASAEAIFSSPTSGEMFTVRPKTSLTISFVTKDPRDVPRLCSVDGCYLRGTVRYYVTVNLTDYVFVWRGRSIVYCGS